MRRELKVMRDECNKSLAIHAANTKLQEKKKEMQAKMHHEQEDHIKKVSDLTAQLAILKEQF